jgi:hypothetical protein
LSEVSESVSNLKLELGWLDFFIHNPCSLATKGDTNPLIVIGTNPSALPATSNFITVTFA